MKKVKSYRLGAKVVGRIAEVRKERGLDSDAAVIAFWAGDPVEEEDMPEPPKPVVPTIKMPYTEYMACLPPDWRVSEVTAGIKTVYDNFGQCQRIFKAGRDY